ncbi:fluoride efflux transporter FluC [Fructilactobacillus sp. Tb1]|uniref:fluoride efflux transporter FluC n=1 Tax=Fructilactobacillus sp. Tb1 TaxID=3422304 RepID=UPI003D2E23C0
MIYNYLIFMLGTGIGAITRFKLTNQLKKSNHGMVATFILNMSGCVIAGILFNFSPLLKLSVLLFGFIGGMTTYSTFNSEIANSFFGLKFKSAFGYLFLSYGIGLLLCCLGFYITKSL